MQFLILKRKIVIILMSIIILQYIVVNASDGDNPNVKTNFLQNDSINENKDMKIILLDSDSEYSINGVDFSLKSFGKINVNGDYYKATFSEIYFKNCNTIQNEYRYIRNPVLNIKYDNEDYILFSFEWENDNIVTMIYELKEGKLIEHWSATGYLCEYNNNSFGINMFLTTYGDCEIEEIYALSNYMITKNEIIQVGDYKIINGGPIKIGEDIPANIYNSEDNVFVCGKIKKGKEVTFTHTDFKSKLWFNFDDNKEGYFDIKIDNEEINHEAILGIYVDGKCIIDYFQRYIDNMKNWKDNYDARMKIINDMFVSVQS